MDTAGSSINGVVTVREWADARATDRVAVERHAELQAKITEDRLLKLLNDYQQRSEVIHAGQDQRLLRHGVELDQIQSVLDQQRGARNLLTFVVGTSLVSAVASLLSIWIAVQ